MRLLLGSAAVLLATLAPASTAAAATPVAAFGFEEGTGTATANHVDPLRGGTITGATWTTAGRNGSALSFDGAGDSVSVPDSASVDLTNQMTLEAWVRPTAVTAGWTTTLLKERAGGLTYGLYASAGVNNPPAVYGHIGRHRFATGLLTLPQNTWSHLAGVYDGASLRMYVNGVEVGRRTQTGSMSTSAGPLKIGGNAVWGEWFAGQIDDVRVYAAALTPSEIAADMDSPVSTPTPDTAEPSVTITAPEADAKLTGAQTTLAATANDDVRVAGVQFLVDGEPVGAEDTTAPYSMPWNTTTVARGSHTVSARARDGTGKVGTATNVPITVWGDFSFTVEKPQLTLPPTGDGEFEVDIAYLHTFTSSNVDLWVNGLPPGVSGRYLFDPLAHQGTTQFLIETDGAAEGSYTFTLGATDLDGSGLTRSRQVTLIVDDTPDFTLTATPDTQNVLAGGAVDYTVSAEGSAGFSAPLSFSAQGLPAGAAASFTPAVLSPPGTVNMRLSTSASTPSGAHAVTVRATDGTLERTTPVTLNVTATSATWEVAAMGSTGTPNNTVRVGTIRTDDRTRVYVGTIGTGRVLEYTWSGGAWSSPVDAGGSPTGHEIHDMTIGDGRGDGRERLYGASHDRRVYEIWHDGSAWRQGTVAELDEKAMHAAVGDGRGDGVQRLYLISTKSLYEYTWDGSQWVGGRIGSTPGAHGIVVASPRGSSEEGLYIGSISSGSFEARWNGSGWTVTSMGDAGDVRNIWVGNGRNDGVMRVYGALYDGRVREYSWNGSSWTIVHTPAAPAGLIHVYVLPGRNDGVNRAYASGTNGKTYEFTWNGGWGAPVSMGGGSDYMYGAHFGDGRNDGITRFYTADRGSVNRVYEYTWSASVGDTKPPTAPGALSAEGSTGSVALSWTAASDNAGVARYHVHRATSADFTPTTANRVAQVAGTSHTDGGLAANTYHYRVVAEDMSGNLGPATPSVPATVTGDTEAPSVSVTAPTPGSTVSGTVTLAADATDNGAMGGVTFLVDGTAAGAEDTTAPYTLDWNSVSVANGDHTIVARARDAAGKTTTSAAVSVTVANSASSGLIARYSFDEGAGGVAHDSTAVDNLGTISGASWTTAGRVGSALSFSGSGNMVTIADAPELDFTTGMTLEAWVRPASVSGWRTVLLKETSSTMAYALYATKNTSRPPAGYVQIAGDKAVSGGTVLPLNQWTHLATTFDGSTQRLFVNGAQVASRAQAGSILTSAGPLRIGGNAIWGEYFNGIIDEVRVYNRALSASEIQADMNPTQMASALQSGDGGIPARFTTTPARGSWGGIPLLVCEVA